MGSPSAWNLWDTSESYAGDVSVYAEVVGTTLKIKVTATTGKVLLNTTVTIPDGNSGYIYYSAVNTIGNFYSINCDRLDDNGNVIDWNTASAEYTIGDINGDGIVNIVDLVCIKKFAANLKTYNFDAANLFEDKYIDASDATVLRRYLLGTVQI
ncbi:MAG: dockerin type I repeat-containing protein [Acutalibacteraceae bacterium]